MLVLDSQLPYSVGLDSQLPYCVGVGQLPYSVDAGQSASYCVGVGQLPYSVGVGQAAFSVMQESAARIVLAFGSLLSQWCRLR